MAEGEVSELPELRSASEVEAALDPLRRRIDDLDPRATVEAASVDAVQRHVELALATSALPLAEQLAVRAAAVLLDAAHARDAAILDGPDDLAEYLAATDRVLRAADVFADHESLRLLTTYALAHHGRTAHRYPNLAWAGEVRPVDLGSWDKELERFEQSLDEAQRRRLVDLVRLLRGAAALAATGRAGAERTLRRGLARGLKALADGNPANAWCWDESAAGNVLLAAKRAIIDATTPEARSAALAGYRAAERVVERLCREDGRPFVRETFLRFRRDGGDDMPGGIPDDVPGAEGVTIERYLPWPAVAADLREVTLLVDKSLRPYADARIELRRYAIRDLRPISSYVLNPRLEQLEAMQGQLSTEYGLSLFDLSGLVEYAAGDRRFRQVPPVVERYYEPAEEREVSVILDGLHRVWLARHLKVNHIWVAEISRVPAHFPVVGLPLTWSGVRPVDGVPSNREKRKFRYPAIADFPDVSGLTTVDVTPENYLYFFYRDLSGLGSGGIRASADEADRRG